MLKTNEETYQKKTQLEHILLRPDTYVGATSIETALLWSLNENHFSKKSVDFSPALYKICDEILSNAADNKIRDPSMSQIKVNVDINKGEISIWNDGKGVPVAIHKDEKIWIPTLIFGHLLTSSNYNDNEKKIVGGRNGYGAKLTNIFSTKFTVETSSSAEGKSFKQTFHKNMTNMDDPIIKDSDKDFTKITFKPDLSRFGIESLTEDILNVFYKRVYDVAGTFLN